VQPEPQLQKPPPSAPARGGPLAYLLGAVREFFAHCNRRRLWAVCIGLFVLTWTIELFLVQSHTLVFPNDVGPRYAFWAPKIRLALDLLFISALTLLVRRRWLIFIVIGSFFVYLGLITYFKYFLRPISILTILSNWREGLVVGGFALDMFPRGPALLLLVALVIQLAALIISRNATLPARSAWVVGLLCAAGYLGLFAVTNYLDPLSAILTTRGVGRLGHIRGYLGPWAAEWYYLQNDELLRRAIDNRKIVYDRITPLENEIPIHRRLVIIQAESLDTNILGYKVGGVEVTPFLNALRRQSMFFRVRAIHALGSSDADFAVLNGVRGSPHENTYSIPNYPYQNTTPQLLGRCGYETYSFHGNSGEFYKRRAAYEQMDFTGLRFQEELVGRYDLKADRWGVRDGDVLRVSAQELRSADKPVCHFVITLTTHTPYRQVDASEFEIFPSPSGTAEYYINNMRYLDNCLRDYVTSLGAGTTVMLYSDHPGEGFEGFECDMYRERDMQFIPCFIYDSDQDLSQRQKTRSDPRSTDGTWNLVDVTNYLRAQIERNCQPPTSASKEQGQQESEHAPPAVR
jgi:phosphoglycerol transferase MdoB-like AlkP superfamily enzyme